MFKRTSLFKKIALTVMGLSVASVLFLSSGLANTAFAQSPGLTVYYPCGGGTSPGFINIPECHFYDYIKSINDDVLKSFQFAVVTGILNAMQFFTQQIAIDTANWMLNGFQGQGTAFYDQSFGDYLATVALNSANYFLDSLNTYTSNDFGFNLCTPISLSLKLSLGIGKIATLPPPNCTFQTLVANYESTYRSLEPENLATTMKQSIQPGGNDISVNLSTNQKFLNKLVEDHENNILQRQEGGGLKSVTDFVSGKITTPANVAKDTVAQTNAVSLILGNQRQSTNSLAFAALSAGLKQIPILAASTFINTLAVGLLQKFFTALNSSSEVVATADLSNPDVQTTNTFQPTPVAITDIVTPNLITSDKQDFLYELSTCDTANRGTWGCSLDDGFVNALRSVTDSGGYTIARAAGIGAEGPSGGNIFLHSDWELIPETDAQNNQDPECYTRAYCSANLAKLRFARIISIGWELAANSPFNTKVNGKYATLEQVVTGFNECNSDGEIDAQHPWCHLINPGWVLTEPQFQCNVRGYGDTVISSGGTAITRIQECEDVVSCLQRDDHGNCTGGYGSCLSERPVWRFGADECDSRYVSCRTYDTRDKTIALTGDNTDTSNTGPQASYLRNTIDYGSCSADNIGCQYYFDQRDTSTTSTDQWVGDQAQGHKFYDVESEYRNADKSIHSPRIYFDATVQTCDASGDGCTKVYTASANQPTYNFVENGSFETVESDNATLLTGWSDYTSTHYSFSNFTPQNGSASIDGGQSVSFQGQTIGDEGLAERFKIAPLRNYVLSYYARKAGNTNPTAQVSLFLLDKDKNKVTGGTSFYRSTNCNTIGVTDAGWGQQTRPSVGAQPADENWNRYTCEFVTNDDAEWAVVLVRGQNVAIDAVELEEGNAATAFVDGDNVNLAVDYLKIAPAELSCKGTAQDRTECANYARICQQTDAGCQGYTDTGGGDPTEIPATLNANDFCPASCVGYAEYRKQASAFDLVKDANPVLNDPDDETSAYFIPNLAAQCSAESAGCEEFTNIESVAQGGEATLFLTYARACEKPSNLTRTYFTWEGSDTTGYQLKTWSLIANGPANTAPPKLIQKTGPDGLFKDPSLCTEDSWKTGADPDCRQFYDEQGDVFYKFYSQTVVSSPDCRDYRKNDSTLADCSKTSGDAANYNQQTKECTYHILSSQSTTCQQQDVSCRAYIGTTGRNSSSVYQETFASATGTLFTVPQNSTTKISYSSEALLVGDYSLKIQPSNQNIANTFTYFPSTTNTLYSVSFWAKTTDPGHQVATIKVNGNVVGSVTMQVDWTRYEIGPFRVTKTDTSSTVSWWGLPNVTYLDQVNVQRLQDVVYAKQNSWTTPAECDQTTTGIPQPQAMLGCREYVDRKGVTVDVRQFSHLCRYETVGCTGYVNTQNSDNPYSESFTLAGESQPQRPWDALFGGYVTTTRAADSVMYLIDEPAAHCDSTQMSCRSYGKPVFDMNKNVSSTETVYLMDDITQYVDDGGEPKMLCRPSELFCDRFVSGSIISYFRDPDLHTCTWQDKVQLSAGVYDGVTLPDGEYSGWFQDGAASSTPCYAKELSNGNTFLNVYTAATDYAGWTSTCPSEQSECTEYRDPNDHTDIEHPLGRSYYFIDNSHLDKTTCAGSVSPFDGCVLFRDMNDSVLTYNVTASYRFTHANGDAPEAPIDCDSDPTNTYCKDQLSGGEGTCRNMKLSFAANTCSPSDLACLTARAAGQLLLQNFYDAHKDQYCTADTDCQSSNSTGDVTGVCQGSNDANLILKVKLDRDCQTWLGCSSGETVYDTAQATYVDLCTNLAVCDELGGSGSNFCGHYLDRTPGLKQKETEGFYEPVLRQGVFLDALTYVRRPVEFGSPDYSSYALPNHFQIADIITRPVGYDMLANAGEIKYTYYHDYRNVASIPFCNAKGIPNSYTGCAVKYPDSAYPDLKLCQDKQTAMIGYYVSTDSPQTCYLSIDSPYAGDVNDYLEIGTGGLNPRNAQKEATKFEQLIQPNLDQPLSQAYPPSECKAYPDATSPFPNQYVTEWDFTKDPPKPTTYVAGYDGVPYCEYGEDCACSYRKVSYNGVNKYYSLYGGESPEGICVGGEHDGEACIPGAQATITTTGSTQSPTEASAPPTTSSVFCGDGSTCQAAQSVTLVRGIYGQCLQRDTSRIIAGSQSYNPCLVWSPAPVLFGPNDVYHYQPTAGYLPPQNSGEYYCVSNAVEPKDLPVPAFVHVSNPDNENDPDKQKEQWIVPPGEIAVNVSDAGDGAIGQGNGFDYDENYVSDGDCFACSGSEGIFIDGYTALGGDMGVQCEYADDAEDDVATCSGSPVDPTCIAPSGFTLNGGSGDFRPAHLANFYAGRWVTTGRDTTHNYAEYFIPLNKKLWAEWLYNTTDPSTDVKNSSMLERNFAYFNFNAIPDPGDGIIGCGYSQDWVDGVTVDNYDDQTKLKQGSSAWVTAFNAEFTHVLSPDSADFLKTSDGNFLQKVPCFYDSSYDDDDTNGDCYIKYWQVGYRDEGQPEFKMQAEDSGVGGPFTWTQGSNDDSPGTVHFETAEGSKAYFAIRAVFEDTSTIDNAITTDKMDPTGNSLSGPWRFIGFWVTAAAPGLTSERAIYMTLNIGHADICKEVAQVIAPDTRDSAAFQDRVWSSTTFNIPLIGVTYASVNPPFGSAKNTKAIGIDPLFQMIGNQPGTQSVMRPPTWVSSGATFYASTEDPVSNWGWLTNLFAKVYRVYRYADQPVGKGSWACVYGPRAGSWCPDLSDVYNPGTLQSFSVNTSNKANTLIDIAQQYCGYVGECDSSLVDQSQGEPLCNALSGVNRGLQCGNGENDLLYGYHVCHNAPVKSVNGILEPQYTSCDVQPGWDGSGNSYKITAPSVASNGTFWQLFEGVNNTYDGLHAAHRGGLKCHSDAVKYPSGETPLCTKSTDGQKTSTECPVEVHASCVNDAEGGGKHCSGDYSHAACVYDSDCRFTWMEWWNGGTERPKPYAFWDEWYWKNPDWYPDPDVGAHANHGPLFPYDFSDEDWVNVLNQNDPSGGDFAKLCDYEDYLGKYMFPPGGTDVCYYAFGHGGSVAYDDGGQYTNGIPYFYVQEEASREGTPDFPWFGNPYAKGLMQHPSFMWGNLWWDGRRMFIAGAGEGDLSNSLNGCDGETTDSDCPDRATDGGTDADQQGTTDDLDIDKHDLTGGRYVTYNDDDSSGYDAAHFAFPGAYKAGVNHNDISDDGVWDPANDGNLYIPGHCERPPVEPPSGFNKYTSDIYKNPDPDHDHAKNNLGYYDAPYYSKTINYNNYRAYYDDSEDDINTDEYYVRYEQGADSKWSPGICVYGELEGKSCNVDSDCTKPGYDKQAQAASWAFCQPVAFPDETPGFVDGTPSYWTNFTVSGSNYSYSFSWDCRQGVNGSGDVNSTDLDSDENICTHNAGYYPRADICGNDPDRQECLTGITQNSSASYNPKKAPLPTDVTAGLYTPLYLGKDTGTYNGDYRYASYYTPRPPSIAAPDTSQACPAAGQCPIALANTFSLENQAEGKVAYVGGQALATIRFYGWAADNQAPLKDLWVDWGDNHMQEVHDAKMKNKKPYCGVSKECQFIPGLTCNTDADCPPASGKCADVGYCNAQPYISCQKDDDCNSLTPIVGATADTCNIRTTFGSSTDDCEQNYFQFEHAYSCGTVSEAQLLPACGNTKYCSRDNTRTCNSSSDCAPGDTCKSGLAPPGGCYDATNNACRFTPRVLLKDSWGWCTGECRVQQLGGGVLGSGFTGSGGSGNNYIMFQNGGCYDGSGIYKNQDSTVKYEVTNGNKISQNTCDPVNTAGTHARPWVIYNGSLQLGVTP